MRASVQKCKNIRGRITGYRASIGPVEVTAPIEAQANAECEQSTLNALARLERGTHVIVWRGHTVVVAPTVDGWSYYLDTFSRDYGIRFQSARGPTREDAEDNALHHLAQCLWTLDVENDNEFLIGLPKSVQGELRGWIAFQRSYAALRATGASDVEAHAKASHAPSQAEVAS